MARGGRGLQWTTPSEAFPRARAAALRALELDSKLATSSALLGFLRATYDWDWQAGLVELERAVQAAPEESGTVWSYAYVLSLLGRHDEAIAQVRTFADASPEDGDSAGSRGAADRRGPFRRGSAPKPRSRRARNGEPGKSASSLGVAAFGAGDLRRRSRSSSARWRCSSGARSRRRAPRGDLRARGPEADARALLAELEARATGPIVNVATLARVYVALGERERALALLEQGVEQRQRDVLTS